MLQCWRQLSSDSTKKQGHSHLIGCRIISVTLRRFMWDWDQCETIICYSWSWLQAIAAPWKPWLFFSIKCRILGRNFTQLSLSSKLQCHLNGAVTMGPAFASCCLIMGGAFYSNLCTTRPIQCDAEPSGVVSSLPFNESQACHLWQTSVCVTPPLLPSWAQMLMLFI